MPHLKQQPLVWILIFFWLNGSLIAMAHDPFKPGALPVTTVREADRWLDEEEAKHGVFPSSPSPEPHLRQVDRLIALMTKHWEKLDRKCDPDTAFALTYLITTVGIRNAIAGNFFEDGPHLALIQVAFAALYFQAYEQGPRASAPWAAALNASKSGWTSITEDVLLGMNAHINYNLAIVMAVLGIRAEDGTSRKPDHNRVNTVLKSVYPEIEEQLNSLYGKPIISGGLGDLLLGLISIWRENAWTNAVILTKLKESSHRNLHDHMLQLSSSQFAKGLILPKRGKTAKKRLRACFERKPSGR
ncbi:MAG: DUF5995 family protein [Bdellovibrionota bacterium]